VHMGQMTNGETHKDDFPVLGGQGKDVSQRLCQIASKVLISCFDDPLSAKSVGLFCYISTSKSDKPFSAFELDTTFLVFRPLAVTSCPTTSSRNEPLRRVARSINTSHKTLSTAGRQSR
jgi:hypothetical protein